MVPHPRHRALWGPDRRLDSALLDPPGNWPTGLPEIWDIGLRNPWRISLDLCTGDLYIGDLGEGLREEIDVEPPGQGLRNYAAGEIYFAQLDIGVVLRPVSR